MDENKGVVLNPPATPEVAFRRSNDEQKIWPGGETAPLCCDVELRIVMGGGGGRRERNLLFCHFSTKKLNHEARTRPKKGSAGMNNECPFTGTVGDPSPGNHAGSLGVLLIDPAGASGNENLGLTARQGGESANFGGITR